MNNIEPSIAAKWTRNWRDTFGVLDFELHGFTFPTQDFVRLVDENPQIHNVRLYLGLNLDPFDGELGFHMIMSALNKDGNDIICAKLPGQFTLMDLSNPCPPVCGEANCLNSDVACPC
jgi:hypothetical protein